MKKILVIEDEPLMRRNLMAALRSESFAVVEAPDGIRGIEMARSEEPDLIICDIGMPGMDGHAVLQAVRADPATSAIPFIFLTGKCERSDFRTGMNLGADDYLPKPVGRDDLLATITARFLRQASREHSAISGSNSSEPQPAFDSPQPLETLGLTPREAEVLLWVAQGKTNPEIAVILEIRPRTVKKHLEHVFEKLGVETRTAATRSALEALMRQGSS